MFISIDQIKESLKYLEKVDSFWGITFLKFKQLRLPLGNTIEISLYSEIEDFLENHYKPCKESAYFYRCFGLPKTRNSWMTLHKWITLKRYIDYFIIENIDTQIVGQALLNHQINDDHWGWKHNYIEILKSCLSQYDNQVIPIFHLAVWIYREKEWSSETTAEDIIQNFQNEFLLNEQEITQLFDISIPDNININNLFQDKVVTWEELKTVIGKPPDILPEEGTLTYLEIQGVGAAKKLCFEPAERLSLITGDNGLGKTFLLECAWWALTGHWANLPAYPTQTVSEDEPVITFKISGDSESDTESISYDWQLQRWNKIKNRSTIPGLLIYARVDGSFAVWDTAKQYLSSSSRIRNTDRKPLPFVFTKDELWNGQKDENGNTFINGLLQDWIQWQSRPDKYPFDTLVKVLERLSPPEQGDLGILKPGEPVRLPYDAREIPTIEHPYGTVPIIHASAGVQRIITMAYLIVWAYEEHKIQSKLIRREPQKRMVILVDELEAHLHPQWQRAILPALLDVRDDLASDLQVQIMVATHSPLVMASVEPRFDQRVDKLFSLELVKSDLLGNEVQIEELPFIRQGVVDYWLMSDVFKLRHSRSLEAEKAIEAAKVLQLSDNPNSEDVARVSHDLARYLSEDDRFWPRWVYFAEQHGVHL
ncbi:AAA family ATPase [Dolichospermum circinale]|uniref:AAA family ATPase n=1 Tax=Dolichospermum circinale TaxID=109265 RepID=UPI002330CB30|nr:AAA family ATPase [Dolichospermum circinale]MDB9468568.1 AAA family ATPase [Dolichospermum circinale CS-539/09]MDB9469455.1 AAA family ATPase [Dolichospermum circinale CS-539]